jgi:hypothetical protein
MGHPKMILIGILQKMGCKTFPPLIIPKNLRIGDQFDVSIRCKPKSALLMGEASTNAHV